MRLFARILVLATLLPANALLADGADTPPALSHNPFSRPPSEVMPNALPGSGNERVTGSALELQATMIGSVNKLANVGGHVLKIGDEVQGYVLVAIHEQYAVFRRNGENTTVYVKPLAEDDE